MSGSLAACSSVRTKSGPLVFRCFEGGFVLLIGSPDKGVDLLELIDDDDQLRLKSAARPCDAGQTIMRSSRCPIADHRLEL